MEPKKILLSEDEIPRQWYNILADIKMNPPLGPDGPVTPDMLAPVFPMNLIEQEVSPERWIDIPEEVLKVYSIWRPSPLVRAYAFHIVLILFLFCDNLSKRIDWPVFREKQRRYDK